MKQTTANRSSFPDSSQRAWRLLSILAAYFGCSESLKPYLIEHLTSATTDRKGTAAAVCLTNLRKTARCGGRKNVMPQASFMKIFIAIHRFRCQALKKSLQCQLVAQQGDKFTAFLVEPSVLLTQGKFKLT